MEITPTKVIQAMEEKDAPLTKNELLSELGYEKKYCNHCEQQINAEEYSRANKQLGQALRQLINDGKIHFNSNSKYQLATNY